jgi:hypothetical protein
MDNRSIIKEWLRDSAIGFVLVVGGVAVSDSLAHSLHLGVGIGYLCLLMANEIPFAYFLGRTWGFFLWWEYLGFFLCVVSMVAARDWLVQLGLNRTLVVAVVSCMIFGCFICLHEAVRSHLNPPLRNGRAKQTERR